MQKNRNPWFHTTMVMLLMLWASMNRVIFCGQMVTDRIYMCKTQDD